MAIPAPRRVVLIERSSSCASPWTMPMLTPKMTDMSGAMIMAPMMTAGLFICRPRVAIAADRAMST
jgi:hypothetical protein